MITDDTKQGLPTLTYLLKMIDPRAWEPHLPPLSVGEDDRDEIVESLDALAQVLQILDIPDASFTRLVGMDRTLASLAFEFLFNSYSTAITNLTSERFALSRSLSRLEQVEEELKNHLASLQHEHEMMKQYVRVALLIDGKPIEFHCIVGMKH